MELRDPQPADGQRIAALVESAMTASYRLSPAQIEAITEAEFAPETLAAKAESDDTLARVAVVGGEAGGGPADEGSAAGGDLADGDAAGGDVIDGEPVVVGYVEGRLREPRGEVRWLFVDPEQRGQGIGTSAFVEAVEALTDAGAADLVATTLEANAEGEDFFEHVGFERIEDRTVDVADESFHAYVYAAPGSRQAVDASTTDADSSGDDRAGDADEQLPDDPRDLDLPETERADGATTARTDHGEQVYLAFEEMESGTDAPFFATYLDGAHEERHGFYCSNCGSLSVTADTSDRIECQACGNDHAERSSDAYDGAYL